MELKFANETYFMRLERLLKDKGYQKKDLAQAIGISQSGISTWSVSGSIPRADIAIQIARFLNVSVEYLILGEIEKLDPKIENIAYKVAKLPLNKQKIIEAVCSALESL